MMRMITWVLRLALFLFLLAIAAKNAQPVPVRFFFDSVAQVPLAFLLLAAMVVGVLLGLVAPLGALLAARREANAARAARRSPDSVVDH